MIGGAWGAEAENYIRKVYGTKATASEIATHLSRNLRPGTTRNAVIGRARRLGLADPFSGPVIWTAEAIDVLKRLGPQNCKAKDIASFLRNEGIRPKTTPAAVASKMSLLKIKSGVSVGRADLVEKAKEGKIKTAQASPTGPSVFKMGKCMFPTGETDMGGHIFCGKPRYQKRSYCLDCCHKAYLNFKVMPSAQIATTA